MDMIVRSFWSNVPIPEHSTNDEVITVPNDSSTIQELFERAARGESLGGSYDEFEEDSAFDDVHDPDMQDPLLRQANRLNTIEDVAIQSRKLANNRKKKEGKDPKSTAITSPVAERDTDGSSNSGAHSEG